MNSRTTRHGEQRIVESIQHHLPDPAAGCTRERPPRVDHGYTVLELIVVVLLIGLLTSVVIAAVGGMRADAADSSCDADRRSLGVAVEAYHAEHGTGPIPTTGSGHDRFERTLVAAGLLRGASATHDLDAAGVIQPEGNSPC
jgi:type II secretory pathway pseudopilin PulG